MNTVDHSDRGATSAKLIHAWRSPLPEDNPAWYEERLFWSRRIGYFLLGRGKASSKYGKTRKSDKWGEGRCAIPTTNESAHRWLLSVLVKGAPPTHETFTDRMRRIIIGALDCDGWAEAAGEF